MSFEHFFCSESQSTGHPPVQNHPWTTCVLDLGSPTPGPHSRRWASSEAGGHSRRVKGSGQASEQSFIYIYSHSSSLALHWKPPVVRSSGGIRFSQWVQTLQLTVHAKGSWVCTLLWESSWNHPPTLSVENYLPQYQSPGAKKIGSHCLRPSMFLPTLS